MADTDDELPELVVLKLGGSVITDKTEPETLDRQALASCAEALAGVQSDLVLVHGAGSYGHPQAERFDMTEVRGTRDPDALLAVHAAMKRLNDQVIQALRTHDVPSAPVHPFSLGHRDRGGTLHLPTGGIETMVAEGFVPVLHGDGVVHRGTGVTVLSGDEVVVDLAQQLDADRVGLCSTVEGVYDANGEVIERIDDAEAVAETLRGSDATDVTGGMASKVRTLLELSIPARVFGRQALPGFLAGEAVGTLVDGRQK